MNKHSIPLKEYCLYHKLDITFVYELHEQQLVTLQAINRKKFIPYSQLANLERMIRLSKQLQINSTSMNTVIQLIKKLEEKEIQIKKMKQLLAFYDHNF